MSAISRLFASIWVAFAALGCSTEPEDIFSGSCPNGAPLPDGGCPQAASTGGATGTGGASTGGIATGGSGGSSTGGGGATSNPDAAPPLCLVNGGGPTRTPPGSCTVLAYCNRDEFRLVCRDGSATCDCRTRGALVKTIANDRDFCADSGDAGTRPNIEQANAACGWNLDTSNL
jgi:hypothetical protein